MQSKPVMNWVQRALQRRPPVYPRDESWVLMGVLVGAARADGRQSINDGFEIEAIAHRFAPLYGADPERLRDLAAEHWRAVGGAENALVHLERVCASAPEDPSFRVCAFAHAADIVFADRRIVGFETRFLAALAKLLALPVAVSRDATQVMAWKNGFDPAGPRDQATLASPPRRSIWTPLLRPRNLAGEPDWTVSDAFCALMLGAAYCDGSYKLGEDAWMMALLQRIGPLSALIGADTPAADRLRDFEHNSFRAMLNFRGLGAIVAKACATLPRTKALSRAVFALAVEISFADRDLTLAEERYLHDLGRGLRTPRAERDKIRRVIAWKNRNGLLSLMAAFGR